MKLIKSIYIYLLPLFFLASCTDDLGLNQQPVYYPGDKDGVEFMVEGASLRTRSVNFSPGSMVKINSVWVGIFDTDDPVKENNDGSYRCISKNSLDQSFIEINSTGEGDKHYTNLIKVDLDPPSDDAINHRFIMISIVNYNGVRDQYGNLLEERLRNVKSWKEFINIAVDTKSGYSYPHDADSPIMAGFLRIKDDAKRSVTHIQVDQFNNEVLFPESLMDLEKTQEVTDILFNWQGDNYNISNRSVRLRRLVANINVNIEVINPELEITSVSYKRHNMPESVYIIERRTVNYNYDENESAQIDTPVTLPSDTTEAANYADKVWVRYLDNDSPTPGYKDDSDWLIDANRDSKTGQWNFSFQHFANKHWAKESIQKDVKDPYMLPKEYSEYYKKRETRETVVKSYPNGETEEVHLFKALADNIDHFNNKASYFEVKMHIVDSKSNRCADAVYVIHEGNSSLADGRESTLNGEDKAQPIGNLDDFVCARNISYQYNIKVVDFDNILLNVTGNPEDPSYEHHPDQGGKVWKMNYMNDPEGNQRHFYMDEEYENGNFENILKGNRGQYNVEISMPTNVEGEYETGKYVEFKEAVTFDPYPNVAFRLYGFTNYRTKYNLNEELDTPGIAGYNYNFERSSFENLYGLWPKSAGAYSHYFMDDLSLDIQQIPEDLRNGIVFKEVGNDYAMNMIEFVNHASVQDEQKKYNVYVRQTNLHDTDEAYKNNYVRAFYVADRNGILDEDGCTQLINIYCIAQYPDYIGFNYDMVMARENSSAVISAKSREEPYLVDNNLSGTFENEGITNKGKGMAFTASPDLAFRFIGFDEKDNYIDFCYNFDINKPVYQNYKNHWPKATNSTYNEITNLNIIREDENIPSDQWSTWAEDLETLMNQLRIHTSGGLTITVKYLLDNPSILGADYVDGFVVSPYYHAGDVSTSLRYLYIFDKNVVEKGAIKETTMEDTYYQIYGVSQYPFDNSVKVSFKATPLDHAYLMERWKSNYNAEHQKDYNHQVHYTTASNSWCGNTNSIVTMPILLTESDWIKEYQFDFYLEEKLVHSVTYDKEDLIKESDGRIDLELRTDKANKNQNKPFEKGKYKVVVTAIPGDLSKNYSGNKPVVLQNQLDLVDSEWNFTQAPWSSINNNYFTDDEGNMTVEFHNVDPNSSNKNYTDQRNFFFEYNGLEMGIYAVKDNLFVNTSGDNIGKYPGFIATFLDPNLDQQILNANDGPLEGRPYHFKFTTLKDGKLTIDARRTKKKSEGDNNTRKFKVTSNDSKVKINGETEVTINVTDFYDEPVDDVLNITGVDSQKGAEIIIHTPAIDGTCRFYSIKYK